VLLSRMGKRTPAELGYRMPAEWERHEATWLSWPRREGISFPGSFDRVLPALRAMVQAPRGIPTQISAWDKHRSIHGKIINVAGPWRTTGDWWRDDRWARDEWDVAIEAGADSSSRLQRSTAMYRLYRELASGTWFVDGSYD